MIVELAGGVLKVLNGSTSQVLREDRLVSLD